MSRVIFGRSNKKGAEAPLKYKMLLLYFVGKSHFVGLTNSRW